jgi:hypothetical protein
MSLADRGVSLERGEEGEYQLVQDSAPDSEATE